MLIQLLSDEEVNYCLDNWVEIEDGSKTHPRSREYKIKENKESINMPQEVRQLITSKLYNNSYINLVVCPNKISVNFYNEYEEDGFYHKHIDSFRAAPRSNNIYFDYGFSLGLSDDYEGGEFVLETEIAEVVYPVKKGSRKAIIGWMSSKVSYEQSYILKNLYEINSRFIKDNDESMALKSTLVQNYLSKHWGA